MHSHTTHSVSEVEGNMLLQNVGVHYNTVSQSQAYKSHGTSSDSHPVWGQPSNNFHALHNIPSHYLILSVAVIFCIQWRNSLLKIHLWIVSQHLAFLIRIMYLHLRNSNCGCLLLFLAAEIDPVLSESKQNLETYSNSFRFSTKWNTVFYRGISHTTNGFLDHNSE
jgi:hypothetical protein